MTFMHLCSRWTDSDTKSCSECVREADIKEEGDNDLVDYDMDIVSHYDDIPVGDLGCEEFAADVKAEDCTGHF